MESVICALARFLRETELSSPSLAESMVFPQLRNGVMGQMSTRESPDQTDLISLIWKLCQL